MILTPGHHANAAFSSNFGIIFGLKHLMSGLIGPYTMSQRLNEEQYLFFYYIFLTSWRFTARYLGKHVVHLIMVHHTVIQEPNHNTLGELKFL